MQSAEPSRETAQQYEAFAEETSGESPCFSDWSSRVAIDNEVLAWLEALPPAKRQPNLVFAAARWHGVRAPGPYSGLRDALLGDGGAIRSTIRDRSTQTNEVGRLAVLVPVLAQLAVTAGRPLALIEVGASAGLCLYPDAYDYAWPPRGALRAGSSATLRAGTTGPLPLPAGPPAIVWRSGSDLRPLDVTDGEHMAWLATLVWPEQHERRARLATAVAIARRAPPRLVAGDLLDMLPAEIDRARGFGRVVVFHSAVIAYLDAEGRDRFSRMMRTRIDTDVCDWVSNEGDAVLPEITATAGSRGRREERFVLGVNGQAVAWTHGHGRSLTWISEPPLESR